MTPLLCLTIVSLNLCSYFIKQDKSPLGPKFPKYMGAVQLKWIITLPQPPIIDLNIHEKQLWKLNWSREQNIDLIKQLRQVFVKYTQNLDRDMNSDQSATPKKYIIL